MKSDCTICFLCYFWSVASDDITTNTLSCLYFMVYELKRHSIQTVGSQIRSNSLISFPVVLYIQWWSYCSERETLVLSFYWTLIGVNILCHNWLHFMYAHIEIHMRIHLNKSINSLLPMSSILTLAHCAFILLERVFTPISRPGRGMSAHCSDVAMVTTSQMSQPALLYPGDPIIILCCV